MSENERRLLEAMREVEAAIEWHVSVNGCVSRDDMVAAIQETKAAVDKVRDLLAEGRVYGPEWTE